MTDEDAAVTRFRSPVFVLAMLTAVGALQLAFAAFEFARATGGEGQAGSAWFSLVLGTALVVEALWLRTRGADLRPEHALLRGFGRRVVPWRDVQAVVRRRRGGGRLIQLVLESGEHVTLRAPAHTWGPAGAAAYEEDYTRVDQWWRAHRGPSWRSVADEETSG